jgi:hypothetical protein
MREYIIFSIGLLFTLEAKQGTLSWNIKITLSMNASKIDP